MTMQMHCRGLLAIQVASQLQIRHQQAVFLRAPKNRFSVQSFLTITNGCRIVMVSSRHQWRRNWEFASHSIAGSFLQWTI